MDFRILGPVEVVTADRAWGVERPTHRAVLSLLLLEAGRVVSVERLVAELWPADRRPGSAPNLVHGAVSRLRRALDGGADPPARRLVTRRPGYLLDAEPAERDAGRFEQLARQARVAADAGQAELAAALAGSALQLWRGPAYSDVPAVPALRTEARRLEEARIATTELRAEAELALGRASDLVAELTGLVSQHPLRERPHSLLMLALFRTGRQAEALAVYRDARARLVAELGVEPGVELRRTHATVLGSGPAPDRTRPPAAARRTAPAQLPPDIADFVGRAADLETVLGTLGAAGRGVAPVLPVVTVAGPPGVGKTALAVHAAHRLRPHFPDGQVFVGLRGAGGVPLESGEVLRRFLRALGVDGRAIPAGTEERAASYRSLVADRRMLVVLDDAAGEAQVRPLLPGGPGCAVLVTSRARLGALVGARPVDLAVLDAAESTVLLAGVAGAERVRAEPAAAGRIVRACGGLPLAVRIAAAKLARAPHWNLERLAEQLADEHSRLDELVVGDLDVRASFSLSYRQLADPERTAFRRLGLLDATEVGSWVVAALLDRPAPEAERVVDALVGARLLEVASAGGIREARYRLHDLLRAYAVELAAADSRPAARAAVARVLGGWLALAEEADQRLAFGLRPRWPGLARRRPVSGSAAARVRSDPAGWFEAEEPALVAMVGQAARQGHHELAGDLAACVSGVLELHNAWAEWERTAEQGAAAAERCADVRTRVHLLVRMGTHRVVVGDYPRGRECFDEALAAATSVGYDEGVAYALLATSDVHRVLGDLDAALDCCSRAAALFGGLGHRRGVAHALLTIGVTERRRTRPADAAAHLGAALEEFRRLGDRHGEAQSGAFLGTVHREQGEHDRAAGYFHRCRALSIELGDELGHSAMLRELAALATAERQPREAEALLGDALAVCERVGHRLGEATVLLDLAAARRDTGRLDAAADDLRRAEDLFRRLRLPARQARALTLLGDTEADRGHRPEARRCWHAALDLLDHRDGAAADLQAKLRSSPMV